MDNKIRSRTDHYETLRVARTASGEDISRAFASQMLTARMRPDISVARLAMLSVAYETLRDPIKRRAYDASIGLVAKPVAPPMRNAAPFIGVATIDRLNRLADPFPSVPQQQPQVRAADPRVEPRVAGFIAASLRPPARRDDAQSQPHPSPPAQPAPAVLQEPAAEPAIARFDEGSIEDGRLEIGRTAATLGACVIGVAILSIALAVPVPNPDRLPDSPESAQQALTVALPPAASADDSDVALTSPPAAEHAPREAQMTVDPVARPTRPEPGKERLAEVAVNEVAAASSALDASADQAAPVTAAVESADDSASDQSPVTAAAARMPLPNATVAHTIQRIGYACGRVVSTSGVDGAADGVFKVTCSSGDTYQATPVRGRYHFRRWGSH